MRSEPAPRAAQVKIRWPAPDTVEAVFDGHVTSWSVNQCIGAIQEQLERREAKYFLLDSTRASGYDPAVRAPGVQLLRTLRQRGVVGGACVAPSSSVRMIGTAVSFVSGMHIHFTADREDALDVIAKKRAQAR